VGINIAAIMSKLKVKETELIDIGKKLGKSQTKDALVKLLLVRFFQKIEYYMIFIKKKVFSAAFTT